MKSSSRVSSVVSSPHLKRVESRESVAAKLPSPLAREKRFRDDCLKREMATYVLSQNLWMVTIGRQWDPLTSSCSKILVGTKARARSSIRPTSVDPSSTRHPMYSISSITFSISAPIPDARSISATAKWARRSSASRGWRSPWELSSLVPNLTIRFFGRFCRIIGSKRGYVLMRYVLVSSYEHRQYQYSH
ncbi:hypothetical protein I7I48_07865 [Histoplasma ohiense]|nr:hypothetical protein I7I48_07865 [Histoplasma ohiense (nom. inval.)]